MSNILLSVVTLCVFGLVFTKILGVIDLKNKKIEGLKETNKKLLSQKKSSEVRLGMITEKMVPFVDKWPWEPMNFRFIGTPIDGIQFNDDGIVFVEVKTGSSRLIKSQSKVKELVKANKVYFNTVRVNENKFDIS